MTHSVARFWLALGLSGVMIPAGADVGSPFEQAMDEEIRWLQSETLVTTATRTQERVAASGAAVSVLTRKDLINMGARNLMDALKRVPGLGVTQSNIGVHEVQVRGVKTAFSEKVLVLINGHPTNNSLINGGAFTAYDTVSIDDVERVEIVRGPGSSLYGANAFVAVINIITRQAGDVEGGRVQASVGSHDTYQANVALGQADQPLRWLINLNVMDSNGFRGEVHADQATAIDQATGNTSSLAPGRTDYWNRRYDAFMSVRFDDLALQAKYVKRNSGPYTGIANALSTRTEQEYVDYFAELDYQRPLTNSLSMQLRVHFDHYEFDNRWELFPPGFLGQFDDGYLARSPIKHDRSGVDVTFDQVFSRQLRVLFGVNAEHHAQYGVDFYTNFNPLTGEPLDGYQNVRDRWNWNGSHDRDLRAAYGQAIWDPSAAVRVIVGLRYDHYSDFGDTVNPRGSLTWRFTPQTQAVLVYGSAFRAPTFGELYNINNPAILGNPDLEPERIRTLELGLNHALSRWQQIGITGFSNRITDLIAPVASASAVNVAQNVGRLRVQGVELDWQYRYESGSTLLANYTYQYAENTVLERRVGEVPMHRANLIYTHWLSRFWQVTSAVHYNGEVIRSPGDAREPLQERVTLDVALVGREWAPGLTMQLAVHNLFDKQYADPSPAFVMESDYPQPGQEFRFTVDYVF